MSRTARTLVVLCACGLALPACKEEAAAPAVEPAPAKKVEAPKADPAQALLDAAIAARGGLDKLKAAASWTGKSKGRYMGMPYESKNAYRPGAWYMDISMPNGDRTVMAMGADVCWTQHGAVVVPCPPEAKKNSAIVAEMDKAMTLWPLKEGGWKLTAGKADCGGKQCDTLQVEHAASGAAGTLTFDEKKMLTRAVYKAAMMGQPGEFVSTMSGTQEACGVKFPAKISVTFNGMPYVDEETSEIACGPADEKLFAQPEQVKDGTFLKKQIVPAVVACLTHKGPYDKIGEQMGKLMGQLKEHKLAPMGPPMMFYLKSPPKVKKPDKFVTSLCFPVATKPPDKPEQKGEIHVKAMPAMSVLAVYGLGPYDKKGEELMKALMAEAKKRKLKPAGPVCQISHMDPDKYKPEELVSEMLLPIKAKKGKKKKKKG